MVRQVPAQSFGQLITGMTNIEFVKRNGIQNVGAVLHTNKKAPQNARLSVGALPVPIFHRDGFEPRTLPTIGRDALNQLMYAYQ